MNSYDLLQTKMDVFMKKTKHGRLSIVGLFKFATILPKHKAVMNCYENVLLWHKLLTFYN